MCRLAVLMVIVLFALAACDPVGETRQDPNLVAAAAHATLGAATAAARSTYEAEMSAAATATLRAAATRQASDAERQLLEVQIQATREAVAAVQTVGAETAQAEARVATGTAVVQTTATAGAREAAIWRATETAIVYELDQAAQALRFREFLYWFGGVSLVVLAVLIGLAIIKLVDWWIVWKDRQNMVLESTRGIILFQWIDGELVPMLPNSPAVLPARAVSGSQSGAYPLTPSGSVYVSPPAPAARGSNTVHSQAISLVEDALAAGYPDGEIKLPGWRDLDGWSSSVWQRVVAALVAAGLAEARPGAGTFITDKAGGSLGGLLYTLSTNQVHLRPTPPRGHHD